MKLLVNGKVVSEPLTLPFSLSFIRGDGLFETILGIDEKIIAWQRHYERLVKSAEKLLITHLNKLNENQTVMLKLSLPNKPNLYQDLVNHPRVLKVVALSGGYSRDDANKMLAENHGVIASFSRALTEGLSAKQSDDQFDALLDSTIQSIFNASVNKK